jgi:hypothetical protein
VRIRTPRFRRRLGALGPRHGGANEAVLDMLEQIGTVDNIPKYLGMVKDKSSHFRLMGFGHRVYKNFDPRAKIIREMCHRVLEKLGRTDNPLFELALKLEEIALKDEYFVSRKLYPNVDFYSGIIYSALGIPRSMFTVMFAIARTVGWVAHWQEMISDPHMKIGRPRQLYTGATKRDYRLVEQRLHFERVGPFHGLAIDRAYRRLPDAVGGKHRRFDLEVIDLEAHSRVGEHPFRIHFHALFRDFVGNAAVHELQTLPIPRVREQMQLHVGVLGSRPTQHRADQPRLEFLQVAHGAQRGTALGVKRFGVGFAAKQALVLDERRFDLSVLRQYR